MVTIATNATNSGRAALRRGVLLKNISSPKIANAGIQSASAAICGSADQASADLQSSASAEPPSQRPAWATNVPPT